MQVMSGWCGRVCGRMGTGVGPVLLLLLSAALRCHGTSPPGKPALIGCRSPEKETFTCWWKPGSDGGLPTVHRLFYEKDQSNRILECPDYSSAGSHSCFFNKSYTTLWEEYYLTVVASNGLGNTSSDLLKIDVMKILKPDPPENVTLWVRDRDHSPYLHIRWQRPHNTDNKSGWVTIKYELRVKHESGADWKHHSSGTESFLNLYNIEPGAVHMVQVRCAIDHSSWSEWSNTTSVTIPDNLKPEKPLWTLVSTLSLIPLMATLCVLVMKRKIVKQWLLPPVPGPKIRGVDVQLLKTGRSEDVVNAIIGLHNFPPTSAWTNQVEEYLIVSDSSNLLSPHPYTSQKKRIIPAGLRLDADIQCKESTPSQSDWTDKVDHLDSLLDMNPLGTSPEKQQGPIAKLPSIDRAASDHTLRPIASTGYVEHQQGPEQPPAGTQEDYSRVSEVNGEGILIQGIGEVTSSEEGLPEDYSRVKELSGGNTVLLQMNDGRGDSLSQEKENHSTEWSSQKPKKHQVTECSKAMCTELVSNGYVDSVPMFSFR
ncbi:unnamed protein product [Menidia menidia]|uniref:Prolactin receptor n=1 Tax=Menidia menidia TaxID=238744 RepID=A0A8S4B1Y0_9TELE|nr:unnamed protein product [Menidia menidia]